MSTFIQPTRIVVLLATVLCLSGCTTSIADTHRDRSFAALISSLGPSIRSNYESSLELKDHLERIAFSLGRPAFEERFYTGGEEGTPEYKIFMEIFDFAARADRTLACNGLNSIDLGIGYPGTTHFTREQVHSFLEREKDKDLLVVWISPGFLGTTDTDAETISDLKSFVQNLRYRRVLILGGHAEGVSVIFDSAGLNHASQSDSTGSRAAAPVYR